MKVTVKLLATYRGMLPPETEGNTCEVEIVEGARIDEILQKFDIPLDESTVVLLNGHTPKPKQPLQEGDVICAFPAMAGG